MSASAFNEALDRGGGSAEKIDTLQNFSVRRMPSKPIGVVPSRERLYPPRYGLPRRPLDLPAANHTIHEQI
jgi:hypothetical protein